MPKKKKENKNDKPLVDKVKDAVKESVDKVKDKVDEVSHKNLAKEWIALMQSDSSQSEFFTQVTGISGVDLMEGLDTLPDRVVQVTTVEQLKGYLNQ